MKVKKGKFFQTKIPYLPQYIWHELQSVLILCRKMLNCLTLNCTVFQRTMPYLQVSIPVQEDFADILSDALMEQGALSVAIEDASAGTEQEEPIFGEPGMQQRVWHKSVLTALFVDGANVAEMVTVSLHAVGLDDVEFDVQTVPDQDWVRLTQEQFDPVKISDRLWITPTWHEPVDNGAVHLRLDPGLAFGTGSHPTTHLCLQWLDNHLHGSERVLDYGCGSGILAIAAMKLGATAAIGVDIDEQAVRAGTDNAKRNGVNAVFCLSGGLTEDEQFDVVISNILSNTLRMLGDVLASRTRTGGQIVLSGILEDQVDELSGIYAQWFDMNPPVYEQGWACLSGIKRA